MPNPTSTLERSVADDKQNSIRRNQSAVYSREQQEQLLILQAEVELLLIQIQTKAAQTSSAV